MNNKESSNHSTEECYLCLLELNEKVQLEKVDLKHLKQKHPYIRSIKAYKELCQHLKKIYFDYDQEKKSILDFLKPFSRYLGSTLASIIASLIAAYLFEKFYGDKNQHEKEINSLLKKLNEYQELKPADKKSIAFIKIFNFFKNIINKNTTEALNFISDAKVINISKLIITRDIEFIPLGSLETKIEKRDFFLKSYNIISPLKVNFFSSQILQEGELTEYDDWQVITGMFDYESDSNLRKSKAKADNSFSDRYEIHFSSKGIERIDYEFCDFF